MTTTTSTTLLAERRGRRWPAGISLAVAACVSIGLWILGAFVVLQLV